MRYTPPTARNANANVLRVDSVALEAGFRKRNRGSRDKRGERRLPAAALHLSAPKGAWKTTLPLPSTSATSNITQLPASFLVHPGKARRRGVAVRRGRVFGHEARWAGEQGVVAGPVVHHVHCLLQLVVSGERAAQEG